MSTLAQDHDCLLLDLDGTVFRGHEPTPGAVETLAVVGSRALFVTNNASRGPAEVAQHLCAMGFTAKPDDVVTSAQSAARLLQEQLQPGAAVLIVGTDSLAAEVRKVGLKPVRQWSTARSPSCRVIRRRPAGRTSPKQRWPSAAEPCGSPRTSTRRCRPNAAYCQETARWSPRCGPPPTREPQVAGKPEPTLADGCVGARQVSRSARHRRPSRHRHRRRQRRRPTQPARALRCQHSSRDRARRGRAAAQLHRRRPALAVRPRRQPSRRAAPGVAGRRRPDGGDGAVDRPRRWRPAIGGPRHRQRGLERRSSTGGASSDGRRRHSATGDGPLVAARARRID